MTTQKTGPAPDPSLKAGDYAAFGDFATATATGGFFNPDWPLTAHGGRQPKLSTAWPFTATAT